MEPVVATVAVHAAEPTPNVAPVVAAAAVVTAVAEAVPMVTAFVEASAVPMVTAVAEASTVDDIPEATAEVTFVSVDVMSPVAAEGEKRGRKSGTKVPRWTPEEEARLRALVEELGEKDWVSVAGRLETGRSSAGVEQHWQIMNGKRKRNGEALAKKTTTEEGMGEAGAEGEATPHGSIAPGSTTPGSATPGSSAEEKRAAKAALRAEKEAEKASKSAAKEERAAEKAAQTASNPTPYPLPLTLNP